MFNKEFFVCMETEGETAAKEKFPIEYEEHRKMMEQWAREDELFEKQKNRTLHLALTAIWLSFAALFVAMWRLVASI